MNESTNANRGIAAVDHGCALLNVLICSSAVLFLLEVVWPLNCNYKDRAFALSLLVSNHQFISLGSFSSSPCFIKAISKNSSNKSTWVRDLIKPSAEPNHYPEEPRKG